MTVMDDDALGKLVAQANDISVKVGLLEQQLPDMSESDKWDDAKRADYSVKALEHGRLNTQLQTIRQQLRDQVELRQAYEKKRFDGKGKGPKDRGPLSRYMTSKVADYDDEIKGLVGERDWDPGVSQFIIPIGDERFMPHAATPDITDALQDNAIFEEAMPGVVERLAYVGGIKPMVYTFVTSDGNPRSFIGFDDSTAKGELETPETKDVYSNPAQAGFPQPTKRTFHAYTVWTKPLFESLNSFADVMYLSDAFIANKLYNRLDRGANEQYVKGAGDAAAPLGIMNIADEGLTTATTLVVTYAELMNLQYKIDRAYRTGEVGLLGPGAGPDQRSGGMIGYIMSDDFERLARTMVDGDGRPLWQLDMNRGPLVGSQRPPAIFMGYPYAVNSELPAVAADAEPLLWGNMSYFGIRTVGEIYVRSFYDSFTAINDNVMFIGRMRTDSDAIGAVQTDLGSDNAVGGTGSAADRTYCEAFTKLKIK